jgi:hypothetical protein
MEPRNGRLKQTKTKTMTRISTQKTNASSDNSNGRGTRPQVKKGASVVFAPSAPPRLTSRKGGSPVKTNGSNLRPKR